MFLVDEMKANEEDDNNIEEILEEGTDYEKAKKTMFNFTGMSFNDYVASFAE